MLQSRSTAQGVLFQYLACLSTCSSNDKLAFDVGVQETNEGKHVYFERKK